MKTVLLTGATGYIGKRTIEFLLERKFTVHAVTSKQTLPANCPKLFWHQVDLLDSAQTTDLLKSVRPSHLLHFAWYVEHGKFWNAPENLDWVKASLHLTQNFVAHGGVRMVAAGTVAEYDWRESGIYSEETTPLFQHTLYGASKHALHLILRQYAEIVNLSFAWGRIFFLFGLDESPNRLVSSVIRHLLKNEAAKCSHGNQIRDFLFVEDVANAFVALLESDVRGAVNVASGKSVSLKDLVFRIADLIGNPQLIELGAIPAQPGEPAKIVAETKRLQGEVGWQPEQTLDERLIETIDWWRENI